MDLPTHVYHLVEQSYLENYLAQATEQGPYFPATFAEEGFIHCCTKEQIPKILERYFKAVAKVSVVKVAVNQIRLAIKMEPGADGDYYPHIFGGIPAEAWETHWVIK